ncbi:hypothetical protein [Pedobacter mucosus]|uniref:hypothetical protein n=1 Tax=Pedobacter mucosus TaxID=2895286 RepID=UPI001EE416E3|nr:hypothetical protein [Pedobacter mucosus]UKT63068.1 hypothetical protein LOK61_14980 [Pedobacter mucosus]
MENTYKTVMIIKLDSSIFRLARQKADTVKQIAKPLTKEQWIIADRFVIATLFLATVIAAIIF